MGSENGKLRVGLIGAGGMGRALVRSLDGGGLGEIVAAAEPVEDNAKKFRESWPVEIFSDYKKMLASEKLDAVLVATPADMHRDPVVASARAGLPVFVEKPMACSTQDCKEMIAACEKAGVGLMVGQVLRLYPCWAEVIDLARSGRIGKPLGIIITRIAGPWRDTECPWRFDKARCGGILGEVNAHEVDFIRAVMGDVKSVFSRGIRIIEGRTEYEDLLFTTLEFESGAIGVLHSSLASAMGELSGKVQGDSGTIFYRDGFSDQGEIVVAAFDQEPERISIGDVRKRRPDPVVEEVRLFLESVRDHKPMAIPGEEGLKNTAVAEAAYLSIEKNLPVEIREILA